ncbi:MAG: sugar transferase, partial [Candidatus Omnitrophota bacterium]
YKAFGKRVFDVVFSLLGTVFFMPLFVGLAVFIKCSSKGPVFFKQTRMGKGGRLFYLLKFRTMYPDPVREKLDFEPGVQKRITPLGKILRDTKLDELPQLFNVLIGHLSVVGPRPQVLKHKRFYSGQNEKILSVRPGITIEASFKYKDEEVMLSQIPDAEQFYEAEVLPAKLKMDLDYVNRGISFIEDIKILKETIKGLLG